MSEQKHTEPSGNFLIRVGIDAVEWATEFQRIAEQLGYAKMDRYWLISWFSNAIMAGYDKAKSEASK